MRIIFRADGNSSIGLGHFVRSLALAEMVQSVAPCWFAVQNPSPSMREMVSQAHVTLWELPAQPVANEATYLATHVQSNDVVVLDGYGFDRAYQQAVRRSGCRLVAIDDLRAWPTEADLVINHSPGITPDMYQAAAYTRFCLGPEYSLLRSSFLANFRLPQPVSLIEKVLLCFGGADPQQFTSRFMRALLGLEQVSQVGIITGSAFLHASTSEQQAAEFPTKHIKFYQSVSAPEMVALLQGYDAVVCPASTILIESLFLGKPAVTGYYVVNQQHLATYVHKHEQACSLGNFNHISVSDLQPALQQALAALEGPPRQPYLAQPQPERLRDEFRRLLPIRA
jgi:UDP-2,4-diacetamido-2,4,6-trideoxy-beta-L-altropyranose hydrolase